jgi:pimeloyl-ACP methyl ester carboxylesterase
MKESYKMTQLKSNELKFSHTLLRVFMVTLITLAMTLLMTTVVVHAQEGGSAMESLPTIVFVHGAFAESASWNPVIKQLQSSGYPMIAVANPLRGIASDAQYTAEILKTIQGPIILVGHSYGGAIINSAAVGNPNVKALVFVAGFAPEKGEALGELNSRFPGSTLNDTLLKVPLADGSNDLYIQQDKYPQQFAADVPAEEAAQMAVTQRPIPDGAFTEVSGEASWKTIPSWFIFGELDKNIPAAVHQFMAERAKAQEILEIKGASHVVAISHAAEVAAFILKAAKSVELVSQN